MFRNPHVTFCSVRPLLLLGARDPGHAFPFPPPAAQQHACCRCNTPGPPGAKAVSSSSFHKDRGRANGTEESLAEKDTESYSVNSAMNQLKADFFFLAQDGLPSSHPKLFGASAPRRLAFDAWRSKATLFKRLAHDHKATGSSHGCSKAPNKGLQPCQRPADTSPHRHPPSLSHAAAKSQRPFSSSIPEQQQQHRSGWSLNLLLLQSSRPPPPQCSTAQVRALHLATYAPREADSMKDCLSAENEERCRRTLGPNHKLYEAAGDKDQWCKDHKDHNKDRKKQNQGRWKASVLVSLCSVEDRPAFLFTLRSNALKGRHKGDVSFAGGKSDQADKDVVETALREAQEELGITVDKQQVWGVLKPLRDMSGMMIAPVLANLGPLEALSFKPNPQEVEEIFTLSLSHVCDPRNCGYTHFRVGDKYGYTLPVFRHGKHRVWGLTAVALDHTLKIIVPP